MKLSRRTVLASAVPALALAQTPAPPAATAEKPDYLAISAAQNKRNAAALANIPVVMETEPAFHFKP